MARRNYGTGQLYEKHGAYYGALADERRAEAQPQTRRRAEARREHRPHTDAG
jgi:hypothetical protein